jgi:hypothetical protein
MITRQPFACLELSSREVIRLRLSMLGRATKAY